MANPYLVRLRDQHTALTASMTGIQTRAADEDRDLTPDELRSVQEQGATANALAAQIQALTEIETNNRAVERLGAQVDADVAAAQTRGVASAGTPLSSATTTRDRDPGHYRRDGAHSYFGDMFAARSLHDESALQRLVEHNRALDMATEGPGVIPPEWMTQEFAVLARQQRRVANAVRNIPLSSAAPMSMPRQTAGTDAVVAEQSAENGPTSSADAWDSDVDTVAPKATAGAQEVSRQMLDSSNPAVDALIYSDLVAAFNSKVEAKVVAAMLATAGAAVATHATNAAFADTEDGPDSLLDAALAVRNARKLPADIAVMSVNRYGAVLKWKDSTGRPLIPASSGGPQNVLGRGDVPTDGYLDSAALAILASDGVLATFPDNILVARSSDVILFESPVLRFRYEEPKGPETIRLGIWAYTACYVKYAGSSVKRVEITAATGA
jgi:HK97 family phage major capsid protein